MPDITEELNIIATDPYGKNVKQAIYDALLKVNDAKTPEKATVYAEVASLSHRGTRHYVAGIAEFSEIEEV